MSDYDLQTAVQDAMDELQVASAGPIISWLRGHREDVLEELQDRFPDDVELDGDAYEHVRRLVEKLDAGELPYCRHHFERVRSLGAPKMRCAKCLEERPFPPHPFNAERLKRPGALGGHRIVCTECGCERDHSLHRG